jgi:hypothetical protein
MLIPIEITIGIKSMLTTSERIDYGIGRNNNKVRQRDLNRHKRKKSIQQFF